VDYFLLAYIDPGSGALMIQAMVAAAVGGFVFCRQMFANLASKLFGRRRSDDPSATQLNPPTR
jgi:hypothetical protein